MKKATTSDWCNFENDDLDTLPPPLDIDNEGHTGVEETTK